MPEPVVVDPARIDQFGPPEGATFCLVTNPELADALEVRTDAPYADVEVVLTRDGVEFEELIAGLPRRAHVLVVSPHRFFESPPDDVIGPERKLLAMACNSTPTTLEALEHFLEQVAKTSSRAQDAFAERFFEVVEEAEVLRFVNAAVGTELVFQHWSEDVEYVWNQQGGSLGWGEQQILPSGEISVLPIEIRSFDDGLRLVLDGELTLHGYPILHNGTPSFSRADQARIHGELDAMRHSPLVAEVKDGHITDLRSTGPAGEPARRMLQSMFDVDSRYRKVWEIGFAHNVTLELLGGNHAMNEVYGGHDEGTDGCLHWGLGLTPYTQYHLDVISPGTQVLTDTGRVVLG
jgi:hypothetical protein